MTRAETFPDVASLDATVDYVRGPAGGHVIRGYGDYESPYSRAAYRAIQRVERAMGDGVRPAFRYFPLTDIHPHPLATSRRVRGTPTLLIDGVLHRGRYDTASLQEALET